MHILTRHLSAVFPVHSQPSLLKFANFLVVERGRAVFRLFRQQKTSYRCYTLSVCLSLSLSTPPEGARPVPRNRKCGRLFHKVIIRDQQVAERAGRTRTRTEAEDGKKVGAAKERSGSRWLEGPSAEIVSIGGPSQHVFVSVCSA